MQGVLRGLVFAGSHQAYIHFLREYDLNPQEYKYVTRMGDIQGIHLHSSPKARLFFLECFVDNPVVQQRYRYVNDMKREFYGRAHYAADQFTRYPLPIATALLVDKVEEIQYIEELPVYLAHSNFEVREAAKKRYGELETLER